MTGEMSQADVTPEAYPWHFRVVAEYGGTVEPFDQYQGPYIFRDGVRYWMLNEGEPDARWWNESTRMVSEWFNVGPMANGETDTVPAYVAFGDLITDGGHDPDAEEKATGDKELLVDSLASYVSDDDVGLDRPAFLRMVAERIIDDLSEVPNLVFPLTIENEFGSDATVHRTD